MFRITKPADWIVTHHHTPYFNCQVTALRETGSTIHTLTVGSDQDEKFLKEVSFPYSAIDITNVTNYGVFVPNISEVVVKSQF